MKTLKSGAVVFYILTWLLAGVMLTGFFYTWWQQRDDSAQHLAYSEASVQVVLKANRGSHYVTEGKINGQTVRFFVDTGATTVSIPSRIAKKLALARGYPLQASTAAGVILVYPTQLETLEIGPIKLKNVKATINPHMPSNKILLGMSALKNLDIELKRNQLILSQPLIHNKD